MSINLELWEINMILSVLAKQPYEDVVTTIQKIRDQVEEGSV